MKEKEETNFRKEVLKALHENRITRDEAKALIRKGEAKSDIFLFMDDMTKADYFIKSGLEKMGYFGGLLTEGTGKDFLDVKD